MVNDSDSMTITFREKEEDLKNFEIIEKALKIKTRTKAIRFALRITANLLKGAEEIEE
ncbi:MAG: hypothetical protein QW472_03270 [Candidatus Aenigmatarchaeota archaeon]